MNKFNKRCALLLLASSLMVHTGNASLVDWIKEHSSAVVYGAVGIVGVAALCYGIKRYTRDPLAPNDTSYNSSYTNNIPAFDSTQKTHIIRSNKQSIRDFHDTNVKVHLSQDETAVISCTFNSLTCNNFNLLNYIRALYIQCGNHCTVRNSTVHSIAAGDDFCTNNAEKPLSKIDNLKVGMHAKIECGRFNKIVAGGHAQVKDANITHLTIGTSEIVSDNTSYLKNIKCETITSYEDLKLIDSHAGKIIMYGRKACLILENSIAEAIQFEPSKKTSLNNNEDGISRRLIKQDKSSLITNVVIGNPEIIQQ
jgi:hypothetical protein